MGSYEYNWPYFLQPAHFLLEVCANLAQLWMGGVFNHSCGSQSDEGMRVRTDQFTWWSGNLWDSWKINLCNPCMDKYSQLPVRTCEGSFWPSWYPLRDLRNLSGGGLSRYPFQLTNTPQGLTRPFLKIKIIENLNPTGGPQNENKTIQLLQNPAGFPDMCLLLEGMILHLWSHKIPYQIPSNHHVPMVFLWFPGW